MKNLEINLTFTGKTERRTLFHESYEIVVMKTKMALDNHVSVLFCIFEVLPDK